MPNDTQNLKGEFTLGKKSDPPATETPIPEPKITKSSKPSSHKPHFFTSFSMYPDGVFLQNQEADEDIILLIRRDFITNVPWILFIIIAVAFPFFLAPFATTLFPFISLSPLSQTIFLAFYNLIIFGYLLINFSIWYFNVAVITSKRIIDLDVSGILFKNVAETNLDLVQDVSYTQNGSIRSLFDYGDILVQTAGSLPNFEFDRAPRPAEIIRIIGGLIKK